jgi:transcriptional regulator with XRE-family HTH domain
MSDDSKSPSSIPAIAAALKRLYRAKGLRYREVAAALDISEVSVKRYMSGQGLTLPLLERLCAMVDLSLLDLMDMVRQDQGQGIDTLTYEQEEVLATEPFLSVILFLMLRGWTVEELQKEFELAEWEINKHLTRLDALGLIVLFPGNRVKMKIAKAPKVRPGGPLMSAFDNRRKGAFLDFSARNPDLLWSFAYYKLTPANLDLLRRSMRRLMDQMAEAADADKSLPKGSAQWHGLFYMARPIDMKKG